MNTMCVHFSTSQQKRIEHSNKTRVRYGDNTHQGSIMRLFAAFPNYAEIPHNLSQDALACSSPNNQCYLPNPEELRTEIEKQLQPNDTNPANQ